jgi:hypothetical protein
MIFLRFMPQLKTSFFYGLAVADQILQCERERAFFGQLLKKKRELGGTRLIKNACMLCKRQLGAFAQSAVTSSVTAYSQRVASSV